MRQIYYVIRTLLRGRSSNVVKVISLGLGLTMSILLFARVAFEQSFDKCFKDYENLYQVFSIFTMNGEQLEPQDQNCGPVAGAILENFVVSEIVKSYQNCGWEAFIYYYRDKDTKEIDLLLDDSGKLYPMEIKKTATPQKQLTRVFGVIDKATLERGTGAVLCTTDRLSAFNSQNLIVPIW